MKEDDLDVVLSPQRRSFGGGCHVTAPVSSRRAVSPLEKDSDGVRVIGGRRIGSGRIISSRNFDKDHRGGDSRDARDRDRDRDYKDKRFRVCSFFSWLHVKSGVWTLGTKSTRGR